LEGPQVIAQRKKPTKPKRHIEPDLKVPAHILNLPNLALSEKVLLAHIYSFGAKGCWQSNATLARTFHTSDRTVSRWLAALLRANLLLAKNPKGYYRTLWVLSHPDVKKIADWYQNNRKRLQNHPAHRHNRRTPIATPGEPTSPDSATYYNRYNRPPLSNNAHQCPIDSRRLCRYHQPHPAPPENPNRTTDEKETPPCSLPH
jgi:hypothetical protein